MRYHPHTQREIDAMLEVIGVGSIDALFASIPEAMRVRGLLDLPPALGEQALAEHLQELSERNGIGAMKGSFLGAGMYEHFIPSVVGQLLLRGEFLTSYTPYQAEMAQGTLKAIFEFQTMCSEILGFEMANASMYDGAHATAEMALMALRIKRKAKRVLVSCSVHPEYREVCKTYLGHMEGAYVEIGSREGATDLEAIAKEDLSDVAMVIIQSPNFFGIVEDVRAFAKLCSENDVLLGSCFSEPLAFGIVAPPGALGADIAAGEGQSMGVAPGLGGPALGLFACRPPFVRQTPGRLAAKTVDTEGREGYVLTLSTREQHIRRERATSNICTNQGLMALAATIYISLLGKTGFVELARLNLARAEHAKRALTALEGVSLAFPRATFNEFVLDLARPASEVVAAMADEGYAAGLDMGRFDEAWSHRMLVTVTEMNSRAQIDGLAEALARVMS